MSNIENKVVVITGASSGIGEATARLLVEKGAKVVLGARRADRLAALKEALGENAIYQVTDVTKVEEVRNLLALAMRTFGKVDVLYNNAGVMPMGNLSTAVYDQWQNAVNINIMGVLHGIGEVLPLMHKQGFGQIITTDSVAGHVVYPASALYNGTKFAVRAIMEGLRQEERENGIKSTIISPGAVDTELSKTIGNLEVQAAIEAHHGGGHDSQLALDAEDVARAVLYAIDQPQHVVISEVLVRPTKQVV